MKKIKKSLGAFEFKKMFNSDASQFELQNAMQMTLILTAILAFFFYQLWILIYFNTIVFESFSVVNVTEVRGAMLDFIFSAVISEAPMIFGCYILVFFMGIYISSFMTRPFRDLSDYSRLVIDKPNTEYIPDYFSDYKYLTRFAEHFFSTVKKIKNRSELDNSYVSKYYAKIHSPMVDKNFILHFLLLMMIPCVATSIISVQVAEGVLEQVNLLSLNHFKSSNQILVILANQISIMDNILYSLVVLSVVLYVLLSFSMYQKVSGATFAVFSTLRSFLKGNPSARVHLIGHKYLREHTRNINKYLEHLDKNLT
jgi:hypothetical protein